LWTGGYVINKKHRFLKKEVFLKKQCFSSTLEFQPKMLFFLAFKKVDKNSELMEKTPFLH
jgi:hypothetical protein